MGLTCIASRVLSSFGKHHLGKGAASHSFGCGFALLSDIWSNTSIHNCVLHPLRAHFREIGFRCYSAHNPPDTLFLVALPFKLLGKRFVFDHHDLCPELYQSRYSAEPGIYTALLRRLSGAVSN